MSNLKNKKIYLAGHKGMVGSAIYRELETSGYKNIITKGFSELDLRNQSDVLNFFEAEKPEIVIIAAAKVGGILANNTYRAEFIYDNLMIEANLIHSSYLNNVEKVVFLGSSCIYPKLAPQPLKEEYLLTDTLEFTNEPYTIAKIAGIKLCENYYRQYECNFISAMPTNLYGPNDNFNLETSHVLPALIRKFHEAKDQNKDSVTIWGTGKPLREFMYVDDLANAIVFMMENINAKDLYENGITHLNVGTGKDITISDLANMISEIVSYKGKIEYDTTKPDGTPRKLMDVSRLNSLGWKYQTELDEGIKLTYKWFVESGKIKN
ncbi:MAG TPA: GDP-L-fucose synthase [Ignavibacteriaceae bacterium]|jgi:GDP-L-fucose synthase|nr:MAG: GDP-L-fucose synthase [Ignavibacteria bacterium ADurb.Bin266]OQY73537.1 MAG: GDP-fucose synthetase [Ignavibacteriales bacterium UTCHB2]HQF42358.1 GDP-L-fucose synthase [Ignavibacteriaceae bacterium]HQI40016.1 GDP-L-fucose synthase [Ignavibacteriaceae bacterium]